MEWTQSLGFCSKVLRLLLVFNPVEIELIHGGKVRKVQCLGQSVLHSVQRLLAQ